MNDRHHAAAIGRGLLVGTVTVTVTVTVPYRTVQYNTVQYSNNGLTVKGRGWIELVELVDLVTTQLGCNLTWLTRFTGFVVGRRTGGGFLGTEDIQRFCSGADQEVISSVILS